MPPAAKTGASPFIKSDEIHVDTSKAPWMAIARQELGKSIKELGSNDSMITSLRGALSVAALERQVESLGANSQLLGSKPGPLDASRYRLMSKELVDPTPRLLGRMEASHLAQRNAEITKYFDGVKTDPAYDKKGRSFDIASTYEAGGKGHVTAWCAAFVNWCLSRAGAPHLGYATARSWLQFGTPMAHPVYGAVTIISPSSSTGSTTGHVAFFVGFEGKRVKLLGGNQGDRISEQAYGNPVLGYRWPTSFDHYSVASRGVLA